MSVLEGLVHRTARELRAEVERCERRAGNVWCGFDVADARQILEAFASEIVAALTAHVPETYLAFGPDGTFDGICVGKWLVQDGEIVDHIKGLHRELRERRDREAELVRRYEDGSYVLPDGDKAWLHNHIGRIKGDV